MIKIICDNCGYEAEGHINRDTNMLEAECEPMSAISPPIFSIMVQHRGGQHLCHSCTVTILHRMWETEAKDLKNKFAKEVLR